MSYLDAIVVIAQITQALLYRTDGLDRSATNTLWMRRITINSPTPYQPIATPFVATVRAERSRVLEWNSARWRTTDLTGQILGINGGFSVAHALPADWNPRASPNAVASTKENTRKD